MMKRSRWALIAVVAVLTLGLGSPADAKILRFDVLADLNTFDMIGSNFPGHGPFYVGGTVLKNGTDEVIGTFHCWGHFFEDAAAGGAAVVTQEYNFFDRGKIIVGGVEDEGRRAIVGGTREFKHISGEARGFDLSEFPFFDVVLRYRKN